MTTHKELAEALRYWATTTPVTTEDVWDFSNMLRAVGLTVMPMEATPEMIEAMTTADRTKGLTFSDLMRSIYAAAITSGEVK